MSVRLIWKTEKAEELIAYCARVSSTHQDNPEYEKLLTYLVKNKHWSPFEMAYMCVEIETTRAISPQILRHRSFTFQEFSQRYQKVKDIIIPEIREEHQINRQSSLEPHSEQDKYHEKIDNLYKQSIELYNEMIENGVAKETARMILPLSTKTKLYMCGSLRSWIHYFSIRCDEHTQKEHRDIACAIKEIFSSEFPTISKML